MFLSLVCTLTLCFLIGDFQAEMPHGTISTHGNLYNRQYSKYLNCIWYDPHNTHEQWKIYYQNCHKFISLNKIQQSWVVVQYFQFWNTRQLRDILIFFKRCVVAACFSLFFFIFFFDPFINLDWLALSMKGNIYRSSRILIKHSEKY